MLTAAILNKHLIWKFDAHQFRWQPSVLTQSSDSRTCLSTVSDSRWKTFYSGSGNKAQCEPTQRVTCSVEILLLGT